MTEEAISELKAIAEAGVLGWPSDPARRSAFEELRAARLIERHGEAGGVKLWRLAPAGHETVSGKGRGGDLD